MRTPATAHSFVRLLTISVCACLSAVVFSTAVAAAAAASSSSFSSGSGRRSHRPHSASPSSSSSCLYDILGCSKSATPAELKKAYRRACLQHHPDKGGDEATFKEINRAYEILTHPETRQLYDQYGQAGVDAAAASAGRTGGGGFTQQSVPPEFFARSTGGGGPFSSTSSFHFSSTTSGNDFGGVDPRELFGMFGGIPGGAEMDDPSAFFGASVGATPRRQRRGTTSSGGAYFDDHGQVNLEDLLRQMMGNNEPGQTQPPHHHHHRSHAHPSQQQTQQKAFERTVSCTLEELYSGAVKKLKVRQGSQYSKVYSISIKPGWKAGTKIKFPATSTFPYPMHFVVAEKPHAVFQRRGDDLVYRHAVPPSNGGSKSTAVVVEVPLLDGSLWSRAIPSHLYRPGQSITVPDLGMPIRSGPQRGNLIVEFYQK